MNQDRIASLILAQGAGIGSYNYSGSGIQSVTQNGVGDYSVVFQNPRALEDMTIAVTCNATGAKANYVPLVGDTGLQILTTINGVASDVGFTLTVEPRGATGAFAVTVP